MIIIGTESSCYIEMVTTTNGRKKKNKYDTNNQIKLSEFHDRFFDISTRILFHKYGLAMIVVNLTALGMRTTVAPLSEISTLSSDISLRLT